MKTSIKLISLLIIAILAGSCDLERLPYDKVTDEGMDENSVSTITLGTYAKMKEEYYYKSTHYINEYGGDNVSLASGTSDNFAYMYKYQRLTNNYYPARVWKFTYQMIVNTNTMIENIQEGQSAEMDQLLGENYFLRGYLYFTLCNLFGRPYVQSPETNLGIPLKLTSDINDFPARNTVKEVYDQVVKDLEKGASLMASEKSCIFASKEVAYAMLSRVYLYMENWAKAKEYADLVINSGRYNLITGDAYKTYPQAVPESNTETIFAIRMVKDTDYEKYYMASYSVGSVYAEINDQGWGEMYPSESYRQLINQNESDLRRAFIVDQPIGDNSLWLIYVLDDEATKKYQFITNTVVQDGEDYVITETPEMYTSPKVQKETVNGKTRYFVVRSDNNTKYYVDIEKAMKNLNGYPKRFIYKCSLQEGQAHLWSPVLIRLAEIYLNRAEANYYLGDTDAALTDVNTIRTRAQIPTRVKANLPTGVSVLDWVLEERRLELAFEAHRKLDIFRKGKTLDRRYPGMHLSGALNTIYTTIGPTDEKIVEYIPQSELDAYPIDLVQNP
jgi:hypothetical protein